jgi:hypothetical protein
MASDSFSTFTIPASFTILVAKKLTKTNCRLWRAQILPVICAAQYEDLLTGADKEPAKTVPEKTGNTITQKANLDYVRWVTCDKALLGYLLSSLTREILMGVTTLSSSTDVWRTLETMFGVPTQARSVNTRITLATTKKGTSTMAEFYSNMKGYADEMAAAGQALGNDEFVAYVLTGLDEEIYNPFCVFHCY